MNSINHGICSSRIASRGIALTDLLSDDLDTSGSSQDQLSEIQASSSSSTRVSISPLVRLKEKIGRLWLYTVQRWPAVCQFPFILILYCMNKFEYWKRSSHVKSSMISLKCLHIKEYCVK